jgi:hypothetical protein
MNLWKKLTSRFQGHEGQESRAASSETESPGMTYADLERDKDLKERQLSGVSAPPYGQDASSIEEDE